MPSDAAPIPVGLRRSWLFVPGGDEAALTAATHCGADVLCQELEDFTPPDRRAAAREISPDVIRAWTAAGRVAAVRINPLWEDGMEDLAAVMRGAPPVIYLPKVSEPGHVAALDDAITRLERAHRLPEGRTEIVPNVESARGLMQTYAIAKASPRVAACLVASEDMAADLGAERGRDGQELAYVRARFHAECAAADVTSIDCPYTWRDEDGLIAETRTARRLGYTAKSAVVPAHAPIINRELTPQPDAIAEAQRLVAAFEGAREAGAHGVELDGNMVELPTYSTAKRLLDRARAFGLI
ncbi:MAG: CoA ester lyase [Alphaproteobacteria bacterium]|nr:CoA ester lyase [Alphaproteobacteria bacterium]